MIRLLIWAGIIYLLYRTLRNWIQGGSSSSGSGVFQGGGDRVDDLMIQDPYCKVYFPKKDGHHLRFHGEDLYFCSPECRDNFRGDHAGNGG